MQQTLSTKYPEITNINIQSVLIYVEESFGHSLGYFSPSLSIATIINLIYSFPMFIFIFLLQKKYTVDMDLNG